MVSSNTSSIALSQIENNQKTKNSFLDLGNCGLTDSSPELALLANLQNLEAINLGTYYYLNGKEQYSVAAATANQFTGIPATLPPGIKELYINQTGLQSLARLNNYTSLLYFDGFGNAIDSLEGLLPNTNLYSLGLSHNSLSNVNSVHQLFPNLRFLYLGKNRIERLEMQLSWALPLLEELYLYNNQIEDLSFLKNNKSIRKLHLRGNKIKATDPLKELSWLEEINITQNFIPLKVPEEVLIAGNAPMVRSCLAEQSLAALLIEDCVRKESKFLDLGNCGLTANSKELLNLPSLKQLTSLSLGDGYFDNKGEYVFSVNKGVPNNFLDFSQHAYLKLPLQLQELQMRNVGLVSMPPNNKLLTELALLDVSDNKIQEVGNLSYLNGLTELAIHGNPITSLADAVLPASLVTLHISSMQLTSLQGIAQCPKLETLIAYGNKLTSIRPLLQLPYLKSIALDRNTTIEDCPSEVWSSNDIIQIRNYFREIDWQQRTLQATMQEATPADTSNDVKLIILGNSNAGKTYLAHYLETGTCLGIRNSTHGMQVRRWKPNPARFPQLADVEVSIWDFGGQEYYHDAYKLFLGSNAVYIILWDGGSDKNEQQEELVKDGQPKVLMYHFEKQYWLDTVRSFRGDPDYAPLLLVQNKIDNPLTPKRRIAQELHEEYSINESFHISVVEGCNPNNPAAVRSLDGFTAYLSDCLLALAKKTARFTEDFKYIRSEVLNLSIPGKPSIFGNENDLYIDKTTFLNTCREALQKRKEPGVEIASPDNYPQQLNNGGVLVYYSDKPLLSERIFINPRKLSEEIYSILNEEVRACKGEVIKPGEDTEKSLIVDVMRSLEILYPHPAREKENTCYLAPQYLPEQHPIEDLFKIASVNAWDESYWVKVPVFFYKKLLHFLLLRFIDNSAAIQAESSENRPETIADATVTTSPDARYFWKNGILLLKNGKRILIKGLRSSGNDGVVQVSVEDNDESLQKWVFDTILSFSLWQNRNRQDATTEAIAKSTASRTPEGPQTVFLDKLQLSVDKVNTIEKKVYYNYNQLKVAAAQTNPSDANIAIPFKHIIPLTVQLPRSKNVFVSYSHSNAVWLAKLRNHLSGLRRSNLIKDWADPELLPGELWDQRIKEQMEKADVFILLLSAEFVSSEYIWKQELKDALAFKKTIIPVYIEPCDLAALPNITEEGNERRINDFEIIPKYETKLLPVSLWKNEAEALTTVAERIRKAIVEMK